MVVPSQEKQMDEHPSPSPAPSSNALALSDPPAPVKTSSEKEQDLIDLLSITLVPDPSPPHTPSAPTVSPPVVPQQAFTPYNSYVAPWAQQIHPAQYQSQQQQFSQSSSTYPPPPWASGEAGATSVSPPKKINSPTATATSKPSFVPSYRLFEDLVDLRRPGQEGKTSENQQPMLSRKWSSSSSISLYSCHKIPWEPRNQRILSLWMLCDNFTIEQIKMKYVHNLRT